MRTLPLLLALGVAPALAAQPLLVENFDYRVGDLAAVSDSVWKVHSGALPVGVVAENLTFPGYPGGTGNAADVTGGAGSRQDVNRKFGPVTAGSVYASALVRLDTLTGADLPTDYVLHLAEQSSGVGGISNASFRARVFVRQSGAGFVFGLSKTNGTPVFETTVRALGTTYLLVVRYAIVDGASNDTVALAVVTAADDYSQEANLTFLPATDVGTDIEPGAVALRQGGVNYDVTVDGIRVGTSYRDAIAVGVAGADRPSDAAALVRTGPAAWRLTVREAQPVRAAFYDVLGRAVAVVFDGPLGAGEGRALAVPAPAAAGVYVLRVTGARFAETRTVVVR